jgi:hypothetical protein
MNKKDLKMYEAPTVEILDIDSEGEILAGYSDDSNDGIGRPHIKYSREADGIEDFDE